ncbi:MAG: tRNA pseudouridine(55) synthase TruB [Vicinamibacteria bacterium]
MLSGGLLVDKPQGITSHDLVVRIRRLSREKRCGHTGTLDPFATGVMVICLGRATRLARFVALGAKSYLATIRFGFATDSYDRTGKPVGPKTDRCPSAQVLESALEGLRGSQEQFPPPFSAKKIDGKRSHRLARAGLKARPGSVRVEVKDLRLLEFSPPVARVTVSVSSGTYIRSLAHDLGERLGCGAHLDELRRTRVGSFGLEEAADIDTLMKLAEGERLSERLLSPAELLRDLPRFDLRPEAVLRLVHGREVREEVSEMPSVLPRGPVRACDLRGTLVSVAEFEQDKRVLRPLVVLATPQEAQIP